MSKVIQPSFAAGELAPGLAGRVDLAKYRVGAALLENFFVLPHGGVANRQGTLFVGEVDGPARLIPFKFSVVQQYVLVFSENKMRIVKDGGFVTSGGAVVEIVSPYAYVDLALLKFVQSADTIFFAHPSYPPYKLTRQSHVDWTFTPLTFSTPVLPPSDLAGVYSTALGATTRIIQYQVSSVTAAGDESLPSPAISVTVNSPWTAGSVVSLSWTAVPGVASYNVYKNSRGGFGLVGTLIVDSAALPPATPISGGDTLSKTLAFDVDPATAWSAAQAGSAGIDTAYIGTDFGTPSIVRKFEICQGDPAGPVEHTIATTVPSIKIQWSSDGATWHDAGTFSLGFPGDLELLSFNVDGSISARYWRILQHAARTGGNKWYVGTLRFYAETAGTAFTDDNINEDVSQGPLIANNPFSGANDYPGAVGLFQQRLWFGRTNNHPQTIWASRTGQFESMGTRYPIRDDDALEFTIDAREVNEIKSFVPMRRLVIFTSGGEWALSGGAGTDAVTPSSVSLQTQGYRGSADLPPIPVGHNILFAQRNASVIREMEYNLYADVYESKDISILAKHLFRGHTVIEWAYQQDPFGIIWVVRDDGVLLGFTYLKEQDVWGWHHHITDGQFVSICTLDGQDGADQVYFLARRQRGGSTVYYVEKLSNWLVSDDISFAVFADSALRTPSDGSMHTTFSGLAHLEGRTVTILADGNVVPGLVVQSQTITLPVAATTVCVGLPYTSRLQTMKLEYDSAGTAQGKKKKISKTFVRFDKTRSAFIGPDEQHLVEMKFRQGEDYNAPTGMFTGDKSVAIEPRWGMDGQIFIKNVDPVPCSVLAIIPEITTSETA